MIDPCSFSFVLKSPPLDALTSDNICAAVGPSVWIRKIMIFLVQHFLLMFWHLINWFPLVFENIARIANAVTLDCQQRLSWIQVLNCQNCEVPKKIKKSSNFSAQHFRWCFDIWSIDFLLYLKKINSGKVPEDRCFSSSWFIPGPLLGG